MSDWSSYLCASDLTKACRGCNPDLRRSGLRARRLLIFDCREKPRQRIAEAASRPGDAESRPWMACGGESDMDVCRRSEEHTSELQSLMRISYAVFCLKKKTQEQHTMNQRIKK